MATFTEAQRRAFSAWLRTGRLPVWLNSAPAEFKFNPWHDPENGQFTFAGTGRYFGRGGGGIARDSEVAHSDRRRSPSVNGAGGNGSLAGGGSGGGGASGSWDDETEGSRSSQAEPKINPRIVKRAEQENWRRVEQNGYTYFIDRRGRTRYVFGTITENPAQSRSRAQQARAGTPDRRPSDHGGHYIARRYNGPTEAFNHFAQDASFNRKEYQASENQWARAKRAGQLVEVEIEPVFQGNSQRPLRINVWFEIDGDLHSLQFPNEPRGGSRAE